MAGDDRTAQPAYRQVLKRDLANHLGWLGLATATMRLSDVPEAKRAALELARRRPGNAGARAILDEVGRYETVHADSAARAR